MLCSLLVQSEAKAERNTQFVDNQSGSMHAIVTLKQGQKVSVVTTEDSTFRAGSPSTAFSGFLLF
jgi:hypothetical protein